MDEKWRMDRGGDGLQVKILASKPPKCLQRTSKARRICECFEISAKWSQKARVEFFMESKNRKSSEKANVQAFVMMSR